MNTKFCVFNIIDPSFVECINIFCEINGQKFSDKILKTLIFYNKGAGDLNLAKVLNPSQDFK